MKPSNPTIVYKGENVSLEWRYRHPRHMKLVEVFFGIWTNPVSAADKKLVAVNSSGAVEVREEYKSRLSWKVNVTSSVAVFVLHNVRLDDGNKYYGIHVEFDLHYPLIDTLKLQVETKRKGRMVCADFKDCASSTLKCEDWEKSDFCKDKECKITCCSEDLCNGAPLPVMSSVIFISCFVMAFVF